MQPIELIVNADDFGQSHGVNRGVIQAHEQGILTSTSLMTRWDAAREAAKLSESYPTLDVGLHLDMGEWRLEGYEWVPVYSVVDVQDRSSVELEVARQIRQFQDLMGRNPTHLDSHQHVHLREPLRSIALSWAREMNVPLRKLSGPRYCGDFYGQNEDGSSNLAAIESAALIAILKRLPEGVTELCCHPSALPDLNTMYLIERSTELRSLCDPVVRRELEKRPIQLTGFAGRGFRFSVL